MTGYDIYDRVCGLLGCHDLIEHKENGKCAVFLNMLNQICADLGVRSLENLSQKIIMKETQTEALIYGSAMLFSVTLRDAGCAKIYTELYNSKRAKALSKTDTRQDILPSPSIGGM